MKAIVSGLLNVETTVSVGEFPIEYHPIEYAFFGIHSHVSGVGFNIAKALTTLGDDVNMISYLGKDDEAKRIFDQLQQNYIPTEHIAQILKNTPVSTVLFDSQGRRRIYCDLKDIQDQMLDSGKFEEELKNCDIAVLCNINFNRRLIQSAKQQGVLTATDVHVLSNIDDEYNRDFMKNADILFLSNENIPCSPEDFIQQLYQRYHNQIIVMGMGERGAFLFDAKQNELSLISAYHNEKIVNTVGAGDALFSSFLHFYVKSLDAKSALQRAVIFAGVKIGYNGASVGFCTEQDIEKILKNQK